MRILIMQKKCRIAYGFTLVELLVVISIIALLLAILMPALNTVREQAQQVVCMVNMKALGLATASYSSTTGYLPVYGIYLSDTRPYASYDPLTGVDGSGSGITGTNWKDSSVFGTPAACLIKNGDLKDTKVLEGACPTTKPIMRLSYGYNYGNLGSSSRPGGNKMNGDEWIKVLRVQRPQETGMFCDGTTGGNNVPGQKPARLGSYGIYYWEPSLWPDYKGPVTIYSPYPVKGHKRGTLVNINFVDGHAAPMHPKDIHLKKRQIYVASDHGDWIWRREKDKAGNQQ
jgi:prepilin-type N-terminal cleavage/methylation domain-containing protein/prepilin-type processing-associated H-X9-DG protein